MVQILSRGDEPSAREGALALQGQLEAVGFTVEIDFARTVTDYHIQAFINGDFDTTRSAMAVTDVDPYHRLTEHLSSESTANVLANNDPTMDELLNELRGTQGEERGEVLNRIEQRLLEQVPFVAMAGSPRYFMWQENVHDVRPTNDAMVDLSKTWISAAE